MNRLTKEQRLQIVQIYFENNVSVREVYRKLRPFYGRHNRPSFLVEWLRQQAKLPHLE